MNEQICWRTPASSRSNQSSPSNGTEASMPVFFSMSWFPAAVVRPPVRVLPNSGDYAARQFPTNPATRPTEGENMSVKLNELVPELREKVGSLLTNCQTRGVQMVANAGARDVWEQARLWRQSRSVTEIQGRIDEFEQAGASFLAQVLRDVGPQHGGHVTNAPPGYSWHQWGEALDCFWEVNG